MNKLLVLERHDVVASCDNGIHGLNSVLTMRPDVAILDIGIPEMNRHQLAQKIRDELGLRKSMAVRNAQCDYRSCPNCFFASEH